MVFVYERDPRDGKLQMLPGRWPFLALFNEGQRSAIESPDLICFSGGYCIVKSRFLASGNQVIRLGSQENGPTSDRNSTNSLSMKKAESPHRFIKYPPGQHLQQDKQIFNWSLFCLSPAKRWKPLELQLELVLL